MCLSFIPSEFVLYFGYVNIFKCRGSIPPSLVKLFRIDYSDFIPLMQRIYNVCRCRFKISHLRLNPHVSIFARSLALPYLEGQWAESFQKRCPPLLCWGQLCYSLWVFSLTPWTESWLWGSAVSLKHIPHKTPDYVQLLPKKLPRANDEPFPLIYSTSPPFGIV